MIKLSPSRITSSNFPHQITASVPKDQTRTGHTVTFGQSENVQIHSQTAQTSWGKHLMQGLLGLALTGLLPLPSSIAPTLAVASAQDVSFSPLLNLADHAKPSREMYLVVNDTLKALPKTVQDKLAAGNIKVIAQRTTKRSGGNIAEGLRGGAQGELVGNSPGVYWPHAKQVLVSEFRYTDRDLTLTEKNENVAGVTRHEVGHALDHVLGRPSGDAGFSVAYERDVNSMTAEQRQKYQYFIQPEKHRLFSDNGRAEAFAEIFGALHGGGTFQAKPLLEAFPYSSQWISTYVKTLK